MRAAGCAAHSAFIFVQPARLSVMQNGSFLAGAVCVQSVSGAVPGLPGNEVTRAPLAGKDGGTAALPHRLALPQPPMRSV
jgi:hypothetical protein